MTENPYSPPKIEADIPFRKVSPTAAGPIARMLGALMVLVVVPMAVVFAFMAESLYVTLTRGFIALIALAFARIVFTGSLYPKSHNG